MTGSYGWKKENTHEENDVKIGKSGRKRGNSKGDTITVNDGGKEKLFHIYAVTEYREESEIHSISTSQLEVEASAMASTYVQAGKATKKRQRNLERMKRNMSKNVQGEIGVQEEDKEVEGEEEEEEDEDENDEEGREEVVNEGVDLSEAKVSGYSPLPADLFDGTLILLNIGTYVRTMDGIVSVILTLIYIEPLKLLIWYDYTH